MNNVNVHVKDREKCKDRNKKLKNHVDKYIQYSVQLKSQFC